MKYLLRFNENINLEKDYISDILLDIIDRYDLKNLYEYIDLEDYKKDYFNGVSLFMRDRNTSKNRFYTIDINNTPTNIKSVSSKSIETNYTDRIEIQFIFPEDGLYNHETKQYDDFRQLEEDLNGKISNLDDDKYKVNLRVLSDESDLVFLCIRILISIKK